jgi:ATP-dependent DNA ligase
VAGQSPQLLRLPPKDMACDRRPSRRRSPHRGPPPPDLITCCFLFPPFTQLRVREAILDGEVLAIDAEGHARFLLLMKGAGDLHYAAFDLLWLNGRDFRRLALIERKRRLERLIPESRPGLSRVLTVAGEGRALLEAVQRLDLEGTVAKRKADAYRPATVWYKIKSRTYTQGEDRWELFQKKQP